jgi:hypothetical protein
MDETKYNEEDLIKLAFVNYHSGLEAIRRAVDTIRILGEVHRISQGQPDIKSSSHFRAPYAIACPPENFAAQEVRFNFAPQEGSFRRAFRLRPLYAIDDQPQEATYKWSEIPSAWRRSVEEMQHDNLKEIIRKALDKALEKTEENKVRNILDSCMAEIEATRERMLKDQEDIDQLTTEARNILANLQAA